MKGNSELTLLNFVRALWKVKGEKTLEEEKVIGEITGVILLKTMREMESFLGLAIGQVETVEQLLLECKTIEQRKKLIQKLLNVQTEVKNDYIVTQMVALERDEREILYTKCPGLEKFMQTFSV
jgi:hypothetical protein